MSEQQGIWAEIKELTVGEQFFLSAMFTVFGAILSALVVGSGLAFLGAFAPFWVSISG